MKIDNLQFNYKPAFGADIVMSKYLNSGITYAKDGNLDINKESDFFKALTIIKQDKDHDTFEIKGVRGSKISTCRARRCQVLLDGKKVYEDEGSFGNISDGNQSVENTIKFAKEYYGNKKFNKVQELESVGEYKIYKSLLKEAKEKAHSDLNIKITELINPQK